MIDFPCWGCGKTLKAKEEAAGKRCKCSGCNRDNTIPTPEAKAPVEINFEVVPDEVKVDRVAQAGPNEADLKSELIKWGATSGRREGRGSFAYEFGNLLLALLFYIIIGCMLFGVFSCLHEPIDFRNGEARYVYTRAESKIASIISAGFVGVMAVGIIIIIKMSRPSRPASGD